jgi:hypothetical protein
VPFTFCCEHRRVLTPRFDEETKLRLPAASTQARDPYRAGLAKLKAAAATPESRFEDEWKAARLRDFGLER